MVDVVTVPIKREEDEPGYEPSAHAPSPTTQHVPTSTETSAMDDNLAATDFLMKICLVKMGGDMGDKLWPALRYDSIGALQNAVKNDLNIPTADLARLQGKILMKGPNSGSLGIAYLLGRSKVKRSLVALTDEDMVLDFYSEIDAIKVKDEYNNDAEFQKSLAIVMARIGNYDSSDDDSTVALGSPTATSNQQVEEVKEEVIDISDSPVAETTTQQKSAEKKKRKGKGGEGTTKQQKKKRTTTNQGKTPKSKSKQPSSIVTPAPSKKDMDKLIAEKISPIDETYCVISNNEAWYLLEAKFGMTCVDVNHYLPSQEKPVAKSLPSLRKYLCETGLPGSTAPLSTEEKVKIARWVRYTHVTEVNGDTQLMISPDDFGVPINKFMDAWKILRDKFGCRYVNGIYTIPISPSRVIAKVCETCVDACRYFAKFGIQCIPDDVSEDVLSKKDRLSLEVYFASPSITVLNTL